MLRGVTLAAGQQQLTKDRALDFAVCEQRCCNSTIKQIIYQSLKMSRRLLLVGEISWMSHTAAVTWVEGSDYGPRDA